MNLLVTGAWGKAKEHISELESMGHKVYFMQNEKDELPVNPKAIEGVICNGLFLFHNIEEFSELKFIQLTSAGFDRVPMDYVNAHKIKINNARGVYSIPMAEFAFCGVLQLLKQSRFFTDNQRKNKWEKHRNLVELFGKKVCIIGAGNIGTECAKRFSAFGCSVIGVDLFVREDSAYEKIYHLNELDSCISDADVVVLTLPLTDETKDLFDYERFCKMKDSSILVNIARGAVVDTASLIKVLDEKRISGAVLDVFDEEPLNENSPLWSFDNVILTPHNSFVGDGNADRLWSVIKNNLRNN